MSFADFDTYVDRHNTMSIKYDFNIERGKPADALQLWVADMDFGGPKCVREALVKLAETGIFGYSEADDEYVDALLTWLKNKFNWDAKSEWIVKTPGVVFALAMAVQALTNEGDGVLIQSPVYYPFFGVIEDNNRKVVENKLVLVDGHYEIDFEDLENKIIENNVKLVFFCSPHNPVGRVWTTDEITKVGEIALKHGVVVVSDEIHCDIVRKGYTHHIFDEAFPKLKDQLIVCTAPSKTFNIAGLQVSNIFIPNEDIRKKIVKQIDKAGYSQLNVAGLVACKAAYEGGEEWLKECKDYLEGNLAYIREFVKTNLPKVKLVEPEGTYFAWLDFSGLGLSYKEVSDLILNKAKVWLDEGEIFGEGGRCFQRIAYACQRSTLEEALNRIQTALGTVLLS